MYQLIEAVRVFTVITFFLSAFILLQPALLPFWGQAMDFKEVYALVFSAFANIMATLGKNTLVNFPPISTYEDDAKNSVGAMFLFFVVACYLTWISLDSLIPFSLSWTGALLMFTMLAALIAFFATIVVIYDEYGSWYKVRFIQRKKSSSSD